MEELLEFLRFGYSVNLGSTGSVSETVAVDVTIGFTFDGGGVGMTRKEGEAGTDNMRLLLSRLAFLGEVVSILDEREKQLGLSRIEFLGVETSFTGGLSRIDIDTELVGVVLIVRVGGVVVEGETWEGAAEPGVAELGLRGVSLHLSTSARKLAMSLAAFVGGAIALIIKSATAFAKAGFLIKSSS